MTINPILTELIQELKSVHRCHSAILYGSHARGDAGPESDYDVLGVRDSGEKFRIVRKHGSTWLDVFVFQESEILTPNENHLYMADGVVLFERETICSDFLKGLNTLIETPPKSLPLDEKVARIFWYEKMFSRAKRNDVEGNYRKIWSLFAVLEDFYLLQDERYPGPKKAFRQIEIEYPEFFSLFEWALKEPQDLEKQEALVGEVLKQAQLQVDPEQLRFEPIDLDKHQDTCIAFRKDSYVQSFGDASRFLAEGGENGEKYLEWLRSKIEKDPRSCVHIWLGGRIIGQLELGLFKSDPKIRYVNLYYLIQPMRGRGLSKRLDQHAMDYLKNLGCKKVRLSVSPSNRRAVRYYEKNGWNDLGPRLEHPEVNLMEKNCE